MARTPDKIPSRRIRIDGFVKPGTNASLDALLAWMDSLPPGERFPLVMKRLMMGGVVEDVLEDGNVEAARLAAEEIVKAFVVED
jgi:hypothetical protein